MPPETHISGVMLWMGGGVVLRPVRARHRAEPWDPRPCGDSPCTQLPGLGTQLLPRLGRRDLQASCRRGRQRSRRTPLPATQP